MLVLYACVCVCVYARVQGAINYDATVDKLLDSYVIVVIDKFDSSGKLVTDELQLELCLSSLDLTLSLAV